MDPLKDRIIDALAELATDLLELGITSSPDPGQVRVSRDGAAWLHPRSFDASRLAGSGTLRVEVWLVIADLDDPWAELLSLTPLVDKALSLPYLAPVEPVDLDAQLALPDNPSCPAALLVIDLDV
jgi:hypothetical protein